MLRAQILPAGMRGRLRARLCGGLQGSWAGVELPEPDARLPAALREQEFAAGPAAVANHQVRVSRGVDFVWQRRLQELSAACLGLRV